MNIHEKQWQGDLVYQGHRFVRGVLACDGNGMIAEPGAAGKTFKLSNRAILPGLINAHSHSFQRIIRGRTEYRTQNQKDSFWTWRELMYQAAESLTPEDIYDVARMAFLEMALSGITTVGEFHYLHHNSDGTPYNDPNLIAKQVVRAAEDVGLRIALMRVAYARAGHRVETNPRQRRFIDADPETYLSAVEQLRSDLRDKSASVWIGIAPHSVRAVPLTYLKEIFAYADEHELPVHMHVAEQQAEVSACIQEYGRSPVALLESEGLLNDRFTAVHAIHVTPKAVQAMANSSATVCACPITERNLGDGVVPADLYMRQGVPIALGSDSHIQIDLLEEARELEYHLRLQRMERVVLTITDDKNRNALARRLFDCATVNGANSIRASGGALDLGQPADFFTVELDDPSIAGASDEDLLTTIVFSLARTAIRDVVVGGKQIVTEGRHQDQEEIVQRFVAVQKRLSA